MPGMNYLIKLRRVHKEGYKPMNPILETVSIINLERSTDPSQKVLGQLMSMVEGLNNDIKSVQSSMREIQIAANYQRMTDNRYATIPALNVLATSGLSTGVLRTTGSGTVLGTPVGPVGTIPSSSILSGLASTKPDRDK